MKIKGKGYLLSKIHQLATSLKLGKSDKVMKGRLRIKVSQNDFFKKNQNV